MPRHSPKQAVTGAVEGFTKPFTVEELFASVKAIGQETSRATIYRTLNRLLADGKVWQVILPSGIRMFLTPSMERKTLLYCEDCRSIECLSDDHLADNIYEAVKAAGLEVHQAPLCLSIPCGKRSPLRPA